MPESFLLFKIGETIFILFILAFAATIPVIVIGIVIFQLRRRKKVQGAFQQIARTFGLKIPNPKQSKITGAYRDFDITLAVGNRTSGSGEDRSVEYFTYCEAYFPHSLRFLLDISCPQGFFERIAGSRDIKLGNPAFDNKFTLKCYDPKIARRLLLSDFPSDSTQNLKGDLIRASDQIPYIDITDHEVYTEISGQVSDPVRLKQLLDVATALARRFQTAREKFPLAKWEKQLLSGWQRIAGQNDLQFDRQNIRMQGVYKNFPVYIALDTQGGKWQTVIKLKFPESLMIGLKLIPENSIHQALTWLGVQDIRVGNKIFDDKFIVKGKNIQMAKHKLQPKVQQKLLALSQQTNNFIIDDNSMSFSYNSVLGGEDKLKSQLEGMVATANLLLE